MQCHRKIAPILEIARCLVYFPFDYYLIEKVDWKLGHSMQTLLDVLMWTIRVIHVLSILFWMLFCIIGLNTGSRDDSSKEYTIVSKGAKDVESDTSSVRSRNAMRAFFLLFSMIAIAIPYLLAMMARVDTCHVMFNEYIF